MIHTYKITGMTCTGCEAKVKSLLSKVSGVRNIQMDLANGQADIEMDKHVPTDELKEALKEYPKYQLSEKEKPVSLPIEETENKSWLQTYKPILLIFGYVLTVALIAGNNGNGINLMESMRIFMAGFFLVFSFFKMLDIHGFADSYSMYDIVAKKWKTWGFVYVFIELALGIAYATNFQPLGTNIVTFVVMTISIIGVLQSVLNKRKIKCACLGAVFNLPMSTVTIIEDALMIAMSIVMLFTII